MPLTDLQIRKLTPRPERFEVWDSHLPGFGLRVSAQGTKAFVLLYRHQARSRRMTIGRYPVIGLAEARNRALEALALVARGLDPQRAKASERSRTGFADIVDQFVRTYCEQHNRASTRRETKRLLEARFVSKWGTRDVREISKADVLEIVDDALQDGTPSAANHALATIRLFFNWCLDRGLIDENPCLRLKMPAKLVARDRVLSDEELARIWSAARLMGYPFGSITQLLLLTAQRRNELITMRWCDLDFEAAIWTIPGERTKNGVAHVVALTPTVVELLLRVPRIDPDLVFPSRAANGRPFSGFSKSKGRLAALAGIESFTLHDLRRTAATRLAGLGVAPHVIERLLNHVTGVLGGVAGIYNRFKYRDEVRDALILWTDYVCKLHRIDESAVSQQTTAGFAAPPTCLGMRVTPDAHEQPPNFVAEPPQD